MFETVRNILLEELTVFDAALEVEKEKRVAILSANGKQLQELGKKSESLIEELEALEIRLNKIVDKVHENYFPATEREDVTLTMITTLFGDIRPENHGEFSEIIEEYRASAGNLQKLVQENSELMETTANSISNAIDSMRKSVDGTTDSIYTASGKKSENKRSGTGSSLFLNANA